MKFKQAKKLNTELAEVKGQDGARQGLLAARPYPPQSRAPWSLGGSLDLILLKRRLKQGAQEMND